MVRSPSRSAADPALSGFRALIGRFLEHHADGDVEVIRRRRGPPPLRRTRALRRTGEPYSRTRSRGRIAADLGLDEATIPRTLLHDAVEDTGITTKEWLAQEFGRSGRPRVVLRAASQARPPWS